MVTTRAALVALVSVVVVGCGGSQAAPARNPTETLRASSVAANGIASACGQAPAVGVRVLCPTRLPGGDSDPWAGGPVGATAGCSYLISILGGTASSTLPFHVMFGGRCRQFSMNETASGEWPVRPNFTDYLELIGHAPRSVGPASSTPPAPIRLRVVEKTTVGASAALVVRVPPYPNAGIQQGHYAIVWNHGHGGYELSFHYSSRSAAGATATRQQLDALRLAASAMR